ncbi:MAG: beta-propeller fold lactonase family protein, partial [Acidimicrobiia bacterium]|nr:beta-propeller fold lactonase family protein [Acidimicrobiia bacterium]
MSGTRSDAGYEPVTLFVGSYAEADEPGIHIVSFAPASTALEPVAAFSGVTNPSFLAVRGDRLIAVSETGSGAVHAFSLRRDPMRLDPLSLAGTRGDYPCHLAWFDRWIAVSNYGTGNVVVVPVTADGVGEVVSEVQHQGSGPNRLRQEGPHAH